MKRLGLLPVFVGLVFATIPLLAQDSEFRPDYGALDGRRYTNGYFGFSYRFPEGWSGNALRYPAVGESKMYPLFSANPPAAGASDVRYISINADYLPPNTAIKTPKDFLDVSVNSQSGSFDTLHTDKRYVFAGKQFYRVDMVSKPDPGSPVFYQSQISTFLRNYAITFSFMAANSDDMQELVRTMESLNFSDPGVLASVPIQPSPEATPVAASIASTPAPMTTTVAQVPSAVLSPASTASQPVEAPQPASAPTHSEQPTSVAPVAAAPTPTPAPVKTTARRATATVSSAVSEVPTAEVPLNTVAAALPDRIQEAPVATSDSPVTAAPAPSSSPISASAVRMTSNTVASSATAPVPAPQTFRSPAAAEPAAHAAPSTLIQTTYIPHKVSETATAQVSTASQPSTAVSQPAAQPEPVAMSASAALAPTPAPVTAAALVPQARSPMVAEPVVSTPRVESKPAPAVTAMNTAAPSISSPALSTPNAPTRIHISATSLDDYIAHKVPPVYPPIAKMARVEGVVVLDVVLNKNGELAEVKVVSGPAMLARGALDAVRQWHFKPYIVDGSPIEIESQVTMSFRLTH
ncbi:MAG TPA: TonB family protein [Terriglobales bacterium]|nr:TonB family protein [Terriglobales bacterium]